MLPQQSSARCLTAIFVAALAIASPACDSDGDDQAADDSSPSAATDETGCLGPSSGDVVMSPRRIDEGSVVSQIEVSGEELFFASYESIYRLPASGAEPERLFRRSSLAIDYVRFHVRSHDLVALVGPRTFVSIPREGGPPVELEEIPYRFSSAGFMPEIVFRGNKAFGRQDAGGWGKPREVTFFEVDLDTLDTRDIHVGDIGWESKFVVDGDWLYTSSVDREAADGGSDASDFAPELLYRIPLAGGEPELVPLVADPLDLSLLVASQGQLVLTGAGSNPLFGAIYLLPIDGGTPSRVVGTPTLFPLFEVTPIEEGYVVLDVPYTYVIRREDAQLSGQPCLAEAYSWRALAATEEYAWLSFFDDDDRSGIVRIPLELATR